KTFTELVSNLSPERVDLSLDTPTQTVNLRCGATNSNIKGIAASEFPLVPQSNEPDLMVSGEALKAMIHQTVFASAKEDQRPILTGVYTQFDGEVMTMAAADGYRLAVRTTKIEQSFSKARDMVIPAKTLMEVERIIGDEDDQVQITLPGERDVVMFHMR